ncbi:MAG: tetratricopeptide repeat protein [Rhodopirellula sp.]|nr:tetratricopeptide repeat protein [Rhodopirellula sp.]
MKKSAGCVALAVLTAIAASGCNKSAFQSDLATPKLPALIGNTDKLESQLSIARLQEHQGQLRDATDRYQQLAAKNPKNSTIPHRLGIIESKAGNHDLANQHFRRSLELDPHNAEVLTDWGYSLFLQGKLTEAETALRQALKETPGDARATNNLALVLGHAGKTEESLALFRQVSGEAAAWVNLGYVHVSLGEGEKAAKCFAEALNIDDKLQTAANALVQIADLQQQAEQRAARKRQIAAAETSETTTKPEISAGSIVQVLAEVPAVTDKSAKRSDVALAHAIGTQSVQRAAPSRKGKSSVPVK